MDDTAAARSVATNDLVIPIRYRPGITDWHGACSWIATALVSGTKRRHAPAEVTRCRGACSKRVREVRL
jgi:hypothetical protein